MYSLGILDTKFRMPWSHTPIHPHTHIATRTQFPGKASEYASGVPKSNHVALVWQQRAAALGHLQAKHEVDRLEKKLRDPKNFQRAVKRSIANVTGLHGVDPTIVWGTLVDVA